MTSSRRHSSIVSAKTQLPAIQLESFSRKGSLRAPKLDIHHVQRSDDSNSLIPARRRSDARVSISAVWDKSKLEGVDPEFDGGFLAAKETFKERRPSTFQDLLVELNKERVESSYELIGNERQIFEKKKERARNQVKGMSLSPEEMEYYIEVIDIQKKK